MKLPQIAISLRFSLRMDTYVSKAILAPVYPLHSPRDVLSIHHSLWDLILNPNLHTLQVDTECNVLCCGREEYVAWCAHCWLESPSSVPHLL